MKKIEERRFENDPAVCLTEFITEYVATSPANRLPSFNNEPIFDAPMVGFAAGDDPIWQYYKVVAADTQMTPLEAMGLHLKEKGIAREPSQASVISFVLPVTQATRLGMRAETIVPTLRWNHTRWHGQAMIEDLVKNLVAELEGLGYAAIAPEQSPFFARKDTPTGRASNWSQRHAAYAAGLGTFSLNDGLITPKGIAMRCGSVVTDAAIPPTPRTYAHHLANCLSFRGETCRRCIERCPAGAISDRGHDKKRCLEFLQGEQENILRRMGKMEGFMGSYVGCGLCQMKVPCETGIPVAANKKG